jgi:hypothetical protein
MPAGDRPNGIKEEKGFGENFFKKVFPREFHLNSTEPAQTYELLRTTVYVQ